MSHVVLLAAGGTGGHVFPAIATAERLLASGHTPVLITDKRGAQYVEQWPGRDVHTLPAARFSMKKIWQTPTALWVLGGGVRHCQRLVRDVHPTSMIGFGGYPALAAGMAARLSALPLLLHEQNAVMGRTNRLLAPLAQHLLLSYEETQRIPLKHHPKSRFIGTPVRKEALTLATPYSLPKGDEPWKLVVLGGSLGAEAMSLYVPSAIGLLPEELRKRVQVIHQARPENLSAVQQAYTNIGVSFMAAPFFPNILEFMATCHLAISRAGASTLAELSVLGRPAVLVPYPHATDGHQAVNATVFAQAGAAWLMTQRQLSAESLSAKLLNLLQEPNGLAIAATAMRSLAQPEAALTLGQLALQGTQ
jgi:UDP-N-acetylglucosamine--N-acetylmuramyl-(pentapeptide) pyrophosphoryl-undecaprenol N-acetylglucosamine transferase